MLVGHRIDDTIDLGTESADVRHADVTLEAIGLGGNRKNGLDRATVATRAAFRGVDYAAAVQGRVDDRLDVLNISVDGGIHAVQTGGEGRLESMFCALAPTVTCGSLIVEPSGATMTNIRFGVSIQHIAVAIIGELLAEQHDVSGDNTM